MISILWIDDEIDTVAKYSTQLEALIESRIEFAANVAFGFEKIESGRFDIIILDIRVPLGILNDRHRILETFFEAQDDAGFGFLAIASDPRNLLVRNLAAVKRIIICTNYSQYFFERFSEPTGKFVIFSKPELVTNLTRLAEVISDRGDFNAPIPTPTPSQLPSIASSSLSPSTLKQFHELRRTLMSCGSLIESAKSILQRHPDSPKTISAPYLAKLISTCLADLRGVADEYIDRTLSNHQAKEVDALLDALDKLEFDSARLSIAKRTLIVDHIWAITRITGKISREMQEQAAAFVQPLIDELMKVDLFEVGNRIGRALRQVQELERGADSNSNKDIADFDPCSLIEEVARSSELTAREKRVEIRLRLKARGLLLHGAPEQFRLIVENLLDNAIKYSHRMKRELAWVEIRCQTEKKELKIAVENWGSKIESEERERIVEFGERGHHAIRPGSGRGLAIVAEQLKKAGGRLEIKSVRRATWRKRAATEDDEAHVNTFTAYIPLESVSE